MQDKHIVIKTWGSEEIQEDKSTNLEFIDTGRQSLKLMELDENLWRKSLEKEGGGLQTEPWGTSVYELRLP